jgi:transglutaminase-like putative cysteine protease
MIEPSRKATLWIIAALIVAMLPQLARMPHAVVAVTLLPLAWRISSEFRRWKPLPAKVRHGATLLALAALFLSYGNLSGRSAAVSLLTVMLALKMVECYRVRDARFVVSFSLFLCTTQFLFSQGVIMPFYSAATVILALISLTQLQRAEAWAHHGEPPVVKASLISELGFSLRLLALAIPVGLAFFLLFPRLSSPLWGIPDTTLDSQSGLSDSMSPGSIQNLFMDDSPAFRAEFSGPTPAPEELYWRGPVFWVFDGRSWKRSFYGKNIAAREQPTTRGDSWDYTVQLEPNERKWLFALDYPATVPPDARLTMDFQLLRKRPVTQLIQYGMISNPDFVDMPELSLSLRQHALALPDSFNPRTRLQVEQWRQETPEDRAFVRRVLQHFNQEPFHYSLNAPLLGRDSVDEFLFDSRTGFCEHYASSFAVMMRMAGIPARIVTGYMGGWYNELGNYVLVRQSDAHAWAEVWLEGSGWTRVDPTAAVSPERIRQGSLGAISSPRHMLDFSWLRTARNNFDILQQRWNDYVIEYGAGRQARLFAPLGIGHMGPAGLVLVLFVAIAIFSLALFPVVLRIRGPSPKDPAKKAWKTFLKRLAGVGLEFRASCGALEVAEAAARRLPAQADAVRRIAILYARSRYAPGPPPLQELKRAVSDFRPKKLALDVR